MKADRRIAGWADRVALLAALLSGYPAIRLSAQDSQYGIRGLGTPGRWESVRARSTGGAFGLFDPLSPLMEAPLADVGHLTGGAMTATSYRDAETRGGATGRRRGPPPPPPPPPPPGGRAPRPRRGAPR